MLRLHKFYLSLSPLKQLFILFVLNGIFWYLAWAFYTYWFNEAQKPFLSRIMYAAWMSFVITIPLNWNKVKLIFKNRRNA